MGTRAADPYRHCHQQAQLWRIFRDETQNTRRFLLHETRSARDAYYTHLYSDEKQYNQGEASTKLRFMTLYEKR